ncbi:hypothetical protein [Paenibacillus pinihumi]|uniref:hypothetical protein n=1 Tax=Paenibacillus pinihumi TaxID=669462 RepID=UPI0012B5BD3C|nr:hypothetical protein [Paenibacillus pinihumi]
MIIKLIHSGKFYSSIFLLYMGQLQKNQRLIEYNHFENKRRSTVKKVFLISVLIGVCFLSACQKNNMGTIPELNKTPESQVIDQSNDEQEKNDDTKEETSKESLIDLKEYDGTKEITLQWKNQKSSANFAQAPLLPFGLYIPNQMEIYKFDDGDKWGYDNNKQHISLLEYDDIYFTDLNLQNNELQKYEEYVGSKKHDGPSQIEILFEDYFVLEKDNKKYVLSLYYFESEKETALPMFLEVLKHIRYVSE